MVTTLESGKDHRYKYDGFVSYSHADRPAAGRIQHYFESHQLPSGRSKLNLFRDVTDIRSGTLSTEIQAALAQSRCLIVCCSPAAVESSWVQQEISTFQSGPTGRSIIVILLAGEPDNAIPVSLQQEELRYSDLRKAWVFGLIRPNARIELVRALAAVANIDLRQLIPWDAKRRRRNMTTFTTCLATLAVAAAVFPFQYTRDLKIGNVVGALRTVEYCDMNEMELIVTTREQTSGRSNEVALYRAPFVENVNEWVWLDDSAYGPTRKLTHIGMLNNASRRELQAGVNAVEVRSKKETAMADLADYLNVEFNDVEENEVRGYWIAQPTADVLIIVYAIKPLGIADPLDADIEPLETGYSIVMVARKSELVSANYIEKLFPPTLDFTTLARGRANLNRGLPVAVVNNEIWLGMPVREDGAPGGLWRSVDHGVNWEAQSEFVSVASLMPDQSGQKLFLTTAPGRVDFGVRSGEISAASRVSDPLSSQSSATWQPIEGPPHSTGADIQLCGQFQDGTVLTRIDNSIFATGPFNLFRLMFGLEG